MWWWDGVGHAADQGIGEGRSISTIDDGFSLSVCPLLLLFFSLLLLYFVVVDSSKRIGVGRKMAPKKDMLSAPLSSTTSVVARIIDAFAALALTVNAGNGQDVELSLQDGRKILEYPEILLERTWSSVSSSVSSVLDDDGMAPWGLYGMLVSSPRAPSRTITHQEHQEHHHAPRAPSRIF